MRVLIIGAGYVGLPLGAELARRGHDVSVLRRNPPPALQAAGIKSVCADITQPDTLAKLPGNFDWMVNCVASGGGGAEDYRRVYLEGMGNVVNWIAETRRRDGPGGRQSGPRVVYTSSTSVYGQNDGSAVNEESPTEPPTETGRVLLETERRLVEAARQKDFAAMILRLSGIYGPGRGHAFKQFLSGDARLDGTGARFLNMIHRDDVIGCVMAALERGSSGEIYNATDDEPATQFDFFSWLAATLRRPMPETAVANIDALRKRGITNKRISNGKLKSQLGYSFIYPSFREGYATEIQELTVKNPLQRDLKSS